MLKSEPQNNEYEMSNVEVKSSGTPLRNSIFPVRYSSFESRFGCGGKSTLGARSVEKAAGKWALRLKKRPPFVAGPTPEKPDVFTIW